MTNDRELIDRLLAITGMIMEDASSSMIITDGASSLPTRLALLHDTARSLATIAQAVDLVHHYPMISG